MALPARIAHWLRTGNLITIEQALQQQDPKTAPQQPTPQTRSSTNTSNKPTNTPNSQPGAPAAWAKDCLVEDPDAATPTTSLTESYTQWCHTKNITPLPERQLQQYLTHNYGPSQPARINGKVIRVRKGIKPVPTAQT